MHDYENFIRETTKQARSLHKAYTLAMWEAATTGTKEANNRQKEAHAALVRFWSEESRYETARSLNETGEIPDPISARVITRIYLSAAKAQQDEDTIDTITRLVAEIRHNYYNFRAEVDGKRMSDNALDSILRTARISDDVQKAWEASKGIGITVADQIRQLVRVRNATARANGYRDHYQRMLTLNEIDEDMLLALFQDLESATREPFLHLKANIDRARSSFFGIDETKLRPWHYGDRFFQSAPEIGERKLDNLVARHKPTDLALSTYDGMGLEVRDILERSDLFPREGKNQHAFCLNIDREGDVRTLNNLEPNLRWTTTLLHELGHAVYHKYINRDLPWVLRIPPHMLSTEAIALMMGGLTHDQTWLTTILNIPPTDPEQVARDATAHERANRLIFTRWSMVMTHFERALYADPEADLNTLWWDLVEEYQGLRRPDGRHAPDWAAKYHVALEPVYYHNYLLGYLFAAQLINRLVEEVGGIVGHPEAGSWLVNHVFQSGCSQHWAIHIEMATGEPLNLNYFVDSIR